jgi:hypothetical protein
MKWFDLGLWIPAATPFHGALFKQLEIYPHYRSGLWIYKRVNFRGREICTSLGCRAFCTFFVIAPRSRELCAPGAIAERGCTSLGSRESFFTLSKCGFHLGRVGVGRLLRPRGRELCAPELHHLTLSLRSRTTPFSLC